MTIQFAKYCIVTECGKIVLIPEKNVMWGFMKDWKEFSKVALRLICNNLTLERTRKLGTRM